MPSVQTLDCAPIYYSLELLNTDASEPYLDFGFDADLVIRGFPESRASTGLYLFQVTACVDV